MKILLLSICIITSSLSSLESEEIFTPEYVPVYFNPRDDIKLWMYADEDSLEDMIEIGNELDNADECELYNKYINELKGRIFAFKMCLKVLAFYETYEPNYSHAE